MKIAVVVPGGVDASGEMRVVPALLALLERLARRHEVHVFALRQQAEPGDWWLRGSRVHNIGGRGGWLTVLRTVGAMAREHREKPFDIVQSIWSGACGVAGVMAARRLGLRCAVHVAGGELVALGDIGYGGCLHWRGRLREAWVLKGADVLTAASQPMLDQLAALGHHAHRLALGVDLARCPPRAPRQRRVGEALRLVHVASLNRVKDQACLLHAVAALRSMGVEAELDVVGEDTLGGAIQALAAQLGLGSQVRFHGFLTQSQLWPVLATAHVHVVTSRHEAGPLAALEAAVLGVPSVGTAVGHLAEWAPQAALVVPPGDSLGLAGLLARLASDGALRLSLATEAQRRAVAEDADDTCRRFEALHAGLLCGGS